VLAGSSSGSSSATEPVTAQPNGPATDTSPTAARRVLPVFVTV
jgi:hypothetical protein